MFLWEAATSSAPMYGRPGGTEQVFGGRVRLLQLDVQLAVAAAGSAIATDSIVSLASEEKFISHIEILSAYRSSMPMNGPAAPRHIVLRGPAPPTSLGRLAGRKDSSSPHAQDEWLPHSWLSLSWRSLLSGALTPDDPMFDTPETTPTPNCNHSRDGTVSGALAGSRSLYFAGGTLNFTVTDCPAKTL
jgi:hypothetical protein